MRSFTTQPIRVATACADESGLLVMEDGQLVALLVYLEDEAHGDHRGSWYLEAGFGALTEIASPIFDGLDDAITWIERRSPAPALIRNA